MGGICGHNKVTPGFGGCSSSSAVQRRTGGLRSADKQTDRVLRDVPCLSAYVQACVPGAFVSARLADSVERASHLAGWLSARPSDVLQLWY